MATSRAERRLAAIVAADVVGYARLMEQDEHGTLDRLRNHRDRIVEPLTAEHRGRLVKTMGDGVIVEFASIVDAVACAVAIQRTVANHEAEVAADRPVVYRIGVNLGDVVVEGEDLFGRRRHCRRGAGAAL